ncbi:MAG: hypothetical protein KA792_08380 [Bacteroidales bacterium]|nr:hypothetical protein [Bacteroidales bacterium]
MRRITGLFFIGILLITLSSCKEEEVIPADAEVKLTIYNAFMEKTYQDAIDMCIEAFYNPKNKITYKKSNDLLSGCATITKDTTGVRDTTVIDFGENNCNCDDFSSRRGKVILISDGNDILAANSVFNIMFKVYWIKGNYITGLVEVKSNGLDSTNSLILDIKITEGRMEMLESKTTMRFTAEKQRRWVSGYNSPTNHLDDLYYITGETKGNGFRTKIDTPLKRAFCSDRKNSQFLSGIMYVFINNLDTRFINFGGGECDSKATVHIQIIGYNVPIY